MLNTVKILHTADLHLGAVNNAIGQKAALRRAEKLLCLERIFELCKLKGVELLLIAGDLLDNNTVDSAITERFFELVKSSPELQVVFVAGNHDPLSADSPFVNTAPPENLHILSTAPEIKEIPNLPVRILGCSFAGVRKTGTENFPILPVQDDKINIMVIHGDLGSDISGPYNTITNGFLQNSGCDYVALGHIHAFSGIEKAGGTYYAYPGCPDGGGFDELGKKGVIVAELSKDNIQPEFVTTSTRTYECENVDVSAAANSADAAEIVKRALSEKFGADYKNNLYKIILCGGLESGVQLNTSEIKARLEECVYYAKVKDSTTLRVDLESLKNENSLKGKFVNIMLEKANNANEEEKRQIMRGLYLGLAAFASEVTLYEN